MSSVAGDTHFWWLASRAVGVVALILVSLSVSLGLALSARFGRGPGVAARVKTTHEALAIAGLTAIGIHGALLLGDPWLHPTIGQLLVPFRIPSHQIWTGVGILAGWLTALITASFYVRRWIGSRAWKGLHRLTLLVYVMGVGHAIGSGTDSGSVWFLLTIAATALPAVALLALRLSRRGSWFGDGRPRSRPAQPRRPDSARRPLPVTGPAARV